MYNRVVELGKFGVSIGKSVFGREIYAFNVQSDVLMVGGIHAREHFTTHCLLECLSGEFSPCVVPLLNPDGVELVLKGIQSVPTGYRGALEWIDGDFSLWKANGAGVDLNVNWPSGWGKGRGNVRKPSSAGYIGTAPLSEPENKALFDFIEQGAFRVLLFCHSKGNVAYWGYNGHYQGFELAVGLSCALGLPLLPSYGSAGGMKDYYAEKGFLALTLEFGSDAASNYNELYRETPTTVASIYRALQYLKGQNLRL